MRRRSNLLTAELGLGLALVVLVIAFRIDMVEAEAAEPRTLPAPDEPVTLVHLPPTQHPEVTPPTPREVNRLAPPVEATDPVPDYEALVPLDDVPADDLSVPVPDPPDPPEVVIVDDEPEYEEGDIVDFSEVMPVLHGGLDALQRSISYPEMARRAGIEGKVFVRFVVNTDGSVSDAEVVRGIGGGCDEAALEAVRATRFTPGFQNGRPVRVRFVLPVTFRLH